jgi:transglutaminase/protease-like cytokinesis protein 3
MRKPSSKRARKGHAASHHSKRTVSVRPTKARAKATTGTNKVLGGSKRDTGKSKQNKVIAMLAAPSGATIAAIMQQTGWQQHSVRGFLAGVVRRKLKLQLSSGKVDGQRVYRIESSGHASTLSSKPASA